MGIYTYVDLSKIDILNTKETITAKGFSFKN